MPHAIKPGDVSRYEGWVVPTPLFNRLMPCFQDVLEHPPAADEPPQPQRKELSAPPPRRIDPSDKIAFRRAR